MIIVDGRPYGASTRRLIHVTTGAALEDRRTIPLPFRYRPGRNALRIELNGRQHFTPADFQEVDARTIRATFDLSARDEITIERL